QRVDDLVMALVAAEMVERRVAALVLLVDQDRMPLREGAALAVLPGEADVMAFLQERTERQRLTGRPVDTGAAVNGLHAFLEEAGDGAVNAETIGHPGDLAADVLQRRHVDAGDAAAGVFLLARDLEARPFAVEPISLVRLVAGTCLELGIEPRAPV